MLTPNQAHAKGILLKGTFKPTTEAKALSSAPHFERESTPVIARFSNSTGIPQIPDTDANGNPRGFAIRFNLEETPRRVHTDIVSHSVPFFPAKNGPDTLGFFQSVATGKVAEWLATHPEALAFVQAPKPFPATFANEKYYAVNAFKLVAEDGKETFIRYQIVPKAGEVHLSDEEVKTKDPEYLFKGVPEVLSKGPIEFDIVVQIAEEGDVTDDNTVHWPDERKLVTLGTISLDAITETENVEQKKLIFDPIPRVKGIEPSADPLFDVRAALYLISGKERREA